MQLRMVTERTDPPTAFQQLWLVGSDAESEFELTCGAERGDPFVILRVQKNGQELMEWVDIRKVVKYWSKRLRSELDMQVEATEV